ncbi:hypothetical protein J2128_001333 [Methanomicrobium sp. W14]|nr:hypothetical protein [Methanomicrobium sp. W14]
MAKNQKSVGKNVKNEAKSNDASAQNGQAQKGRK